MNQPPTPDQPPALPALGLQTEPFLDRRLRFVNSPTLLRWLVFGRLLLAGATLIQAALSTDEKLGIRLASFAVVALALAVTGYGGYVGLVRRQRSGLGFLVGQAAMDLLLVTAVVHFAGTHQTGWAALYVLVIAMYGLIMPVRQGLVTALFGAALFLADALLVQGGGEAGLWAQIAVFTIVFVVVATLGQRLRAAAVEQSQLETELERVRLEADEILRNIRSGVLTVDGRGNLAFINPTAEQLLGPDVGRELGKPILALLQHRAPELYNAVVAGIERGDRVGRSEGIAIRSDGRRFPIGLSTTTFERESEPLPSVTAIFTDISDLQYLQELHLRTERLEAVAALGASLAHEIRNPLASIRSAVEQLAHGARDDPDERLLGDLILRETDRLSRLLGEFLDFSRVRASKFHTVNVVAVVSDAARMVRGHPDCGRTVDIQVRGDPTFIQGDEDLLHRVAWNLLLNAAQALRGSGDGRIEAVVDVAPASELPRGSGFDFDEAIRLRVRDNGPGIDPEVRENLFQPFVSGRPGGSGLGLAIVQRAVEAHRGLVLVDSAPGQGTTFTILLHVKSPTEEAA